MGGLLLLVGLCVSLHALYRLGRYADFGRFRLSWQWRTQPPISIEHIKDASS